MQPHIQSPFRISTVSEAGFVLILTLIILLMLSLFGAWALRTSTTEIEVAGELQQAERQFNISEGGSYLEGVNLGLGRRAIYDMYNVAYQKGKIMTPNTEADFDPGSDDSVHSHGGITANDSATWPWDNLLQNYTNTPYNADAFDYHYLVTYLGKSAKAKLIGYEGSDNLLSGYNYRIQGNAARTLSIVEVGGRKIKLYSPEN